MIGDCSRCTHSLAYHLPIVGCTKCSCEEYQVSRVLGVVAVAMLCGCGELVEPSKAVQTMESAGYTDVRVTGQHGVAAEWAGCSKGDAVGFDVSAKNPAGAQTTALVCCGLVLKGCTIRH